MAERIPTEEVERLLAEATPGPWWVTDDLEDDDDPAVGIAQGFPSDDGGSWAMVATTPGSACYDAGDPTNKQANASLIAAAPDLAADLLDARRALDEFHASPALAHAHADLAAAKTEIERLREALEALLAVAEIWSHEFYGDDGDLLTDDEAEALTAAQAALSGEET